jgi:hypothetical protein
MLDTVPRTKKGFARIPVLSRERVAWIKLRRIGYQQSHLAKAFGRSSSLINRAIKKAILRGILTPLDLRNFTPAQRKTRSAKLWFLLMKWLPAWNAWIISGEGKPP